MNNLETKLGKLNFANPITVASGTFGYEYSEYIDFNKLGAIITKTITKEPKKGNTPPRLLETTGGLLNSIGLQNPGLEIFIKEELPRYKNYDTNLIISFSGSSMKEFEEILLRFEDVEGIDGYEVNISCPNVENEGLAFGVDAGIVNKLTSKLSRLTKRELIIKLSPNVTDIKQIAKAAEDGGADSLSLINTLLGMAIDWKTGKIYFERGLAGYSGPVIKPVALNLVYQVAKSVNIPILAMGGISNWKDALEFIYAGASVVAIGTQNFINPQITIETIDDLQNYFNENNLTMKKVIGKSS
jgi:dihydroorotate dehydrogenase (NAD+) catalytic subunit